MGGYATINQFYRVLYGNPIENGVTTQSPPLTLAKAWYFTSLESFGQLASYCSFDNPGF